MAWLMIPFRQSNLFLDLLFPSSAYAYPSPNPSQTSQQLRFSHWTLTDTDQLK